MGELSRTPCALLRQRKTVPLTGTLSKVNTCLDFPSILATEYAQAWLASAGSPKVPLSGIVRRALALYMQHLAKDTTEAQAELMAVRLACGSRLPDTEEQQEASQRLQGIQAGYPLPTFAEVLDGPDTASRRAASDEAYGRLVDAAMSSPRARFFNRKTAQTDSHD